MIDWIVPVLIGVVVVGLVGVIYNNLTTRIAKMEAWKDARPTDVLTQSQHLLFCKDNTKDLISYMDKKFEELKDMILNGKRD